MNSLTKIIKRIKQDLKDFDLMNLIVKKFSEKHNIEGENSVEKLLNLVMNYEKEIRDLKKNIRKKFFVKLFFIHLQCDIKINTAIIKKYCP